MPKKGKRSQPAKQRWSQFSLSDDINPQEERTHHQSCRNESIPGEPDADAVKKGVQGNVSCKNVMSDSGSNKDKAETDQNVDEDMPQKVTGASDSQPTVTVPDKGMSYRIITVQMKINIHPIKNTVQTESEDAGDSDKSIPLTPTLSENGPTHSDVPPPNATVKLANNLHVSSTVDFVPSAAETSDSATSSQQTKASHVLLTILLSDAENGVLESESDDDDSTTDALSESGSSRPVDAPSDTTVTDQNNEARDLGRFYNII
ncbi:hypothetical protein EXN66_Car002749 [Channa argus]|uniref:Uncharacterized protein n=1 Tax=Channa argus TaxID=215402 RepID=A0A6G1PA03_CHAAH|nr:hypothetical protein EXN66_Car002749 [Channa argus]